MSTPGTVLASPRDRYQLDRELGRGGFGVTHLARRLSDGTSVVVKRLRMDRLDDWKAFDLFEREARVLEALRHPGIPTFIDHFELQEGGKLHGFALVQEYVPGRTLRELARGLDVAAMRRWFTRLLEICRYLHGQDPPVIHRDINPKNVMLRDDGAAMLIDFGTVQNALRSADTVSSTSAGTFGYAASEQLIGRALPSSDLYGLAMTYLAVASGREPETMPFAGNRVQVSEVLRGHDAHPRLKLLLEEMTELDPARRPARADDVLKRLQAIPEVTATPAAALVPAPAGDLAARIEQVWRERAERTRAIGRGALELAALPEYEMASLAAIDETGAHALIAFGHAHPELARLDLQSFQLRVLDKGEVSLSTNVAAAADGRSLLLRSFDEGVLITCAPDGTSKVQPIKGLPGTGSMGEVGTYAISPDGAHLAICHHSEVALVDLVRGGVAQKLKVEARMSHPMGGKICFVPDGSALIVEQFSDRYLVDAAGKTTPLTWDAVAFAGDGHTVAIAEDDKLSVGVAESYAPLRWRRAPAVIWRAGEDVEAVRWSPDGRMIAAVLDSERIVVLDATSGVVLMEVDDPYRPGKPMQDVDHVGFSADGRRLIVSGCFTLHPRATDHRRGLAVYSLTQRRAMATIVARPFESAPFRRGPADLKALAVTPFGVAGDPGTDPVRAILTEQQPIGAAGLDLADRIGFWGGMVGAGKLPADVDLGPLIEASVGLTHLLPLAVDRASTPVAGAPARFGQAGAGGANATLPVPALLDQLRWLAGKDHDEQDVLFAEMLPAQIARELANQKSPAKAAASNRRRQLVIGVIVAVVIAALLAAVGL